MTSLNPFLNDLLIYLLILGTISIAFLLLWIKLRFGRILIFVCNRVNIISQKVPLRQNSKLDLLIFSVCLLIFGLSLNLDLWYHDHYGLDKPLSPTHLPFYFLMPIFFLIISKYTTLSNHKFGLLWYGAYLATAGFVINYFWHAAGLVESYAAPPHLLFFTGLYILSLTFWKIQKVTQNQKLAVALFFLSLLILVFISLGWLDHPQDLGGAGFVDLSMEFKLQHPHPDVKPLIEQINVLRQTSPFLIPAIYTFVLSLFATYILRLRLFPGALSLIFLANYLVRAIFHIPFWYVPILTFPAILLDIIILYHPSLINKTYFPLFIGIIFSFLFYLVYYSFSSFMGIFYPTITIIQVIITTFLVSTSASFLSRRFTKS